MSKSIKDYKDAMDSIDISDSFYKRTETLLTELPEIKLDKKPLLSSRRITAAMTAAAACAAVILGIKFAVDRHEESFGITTEITSITDIPEPEESFTPMPLVDEIEEEEEKFEPEVSYDDETLVEEPVDEKAESTDGGTAVVTANPKYDPKEAEKTNGTSKTDKKPDTGIAEDDGNDDVSSDGGGIIISTEDEYETEEEAAEVETGEDIDGGTDDVLTAESADDDAIDDVPAGGAAAKTGLFGELVYTDISVELTPYFDMSNIRSGEDPVRMSGSDCAEIIGFTAYLTERSSLINNTPFSSMFSMQITDNASGGTLYSVYVTYQNTLVVTKHSADGQVRTTYAITPDNFETLRNIMFLQFGSESDYELFKNLMSGK